MGPEDILDALKQKILQEQGNQTSQASVSAPAHGQNMSRPPSRPQEYSASRGEWERNSRDYNRDRRGPRPLRNDRDYRPYRSRDSLGDYRERESRYSDGRDQRRDDYRREYRGTARDGYGSRRNGRHDDRYSNPEHPNKLSNNDDYTEMDLTNAVPLDKIKRDSLWDIKPKGFEKVSSERAKISGLFPLPGEARRVDVSKLEGLVNGGDLNNHTSILFEQINIGARYSRSARELVISGVEFSLYPVERLVDNINKYIKSIKVENAFIVSHTIFQNRYLVLRLSNHEITTILYCSSLALQNELNLKIQLSRPMGYITPKEVEEGRIPDSVRKIAILNVPDDITEDEIREDLEDISSEVKVESVKSTDGSSTGIMFVEFTDSITVESAVGRINKIVIRDIILQAIPACKGLQQSEQVTFRSLAAVAKDRSIDTESRVLVLLNIVLPEDLKKESTYSLMEKDIREQCSKYGPVKSIKIPKPDADYKRSLKNLNTSVGKVFVEFDVKEDAKRAAMELNGRKYNERTVLVSFIPDYDYDLELF